MSEQPEDLRKLFEVWVDSDLKAHIIVFYENNPGVIETTAGLAKRLGTSIEALEAEIADHVRLGLLRERQVGGKKVLVYDRTKRANIESFIEEELRRKQEELE